VPEYLFVCGVGRSGTTALTTVLSGHRDIALGVERFKELWKAPRRLPELTPDLFERDRFFDFSDELTNIRPGTASWTDYYDRLADKYDDVRYVGEKLTEIHIDKLVPLFPGAKFVVIIRDVAAMAHSWNVRALNPDDKGWGANRDASAAVVHWNRGLERTKAALDAYPDQVNVVQYGPFFGDPQARQLRRVIDRLGLEWEPGIERAFGTAHRRYRDEIADKPRDLDAETMAFLEANARRGLWRQVKQLTV